MICVLAALLGAALLVPGPAALATNPEAVALAVVGGNEFPVDVGSIVTTGDLVIPDAGTDAPTPADDDGVCVFDTPAGVKVEVPDGADPLEVVTSVQPDCSLAITSITPIDSRNHTPLPPTSGAGLVLPEAPEVSTTIPNTYLPSVDINHRAYLGWVKGLVQEQFGITSTERYTEFRYLENSYGDPSNPHAHDGYCYHSGFPGDWEVTNCLYRHYDGAPAMQWKKAWGDYRYCSNENCYTWGNFYFRWRHNVEYNGGTSYLQGSGYTYACRLENNSGLPPSWDHRCRGGRDRIN
jgi:hypothetical protein